MAWLDALVGGAVGGATDVGMGFLEQYFAGKSADKSKNLTRYFAKRKYQLETQALRRGGLNPILAAGKYGGTTAPSVGYANVGSGAAGAGVQSALAAKRLSSELKLLEAQTVKTWEESRAVSAHGWKEHFLSKIAEQDLNSAKAAAAAAKSEEEFYKSDIGKALRKIDLFGRAINPFMDATGSAQQQYLRGKGVKR